MKTWVGKLLKKDLNNFIESLKCEVYAPVKKEDIRFEKITSADEIYWNANSDFPLKQFFFRNKEVLFEFDNGKLKEKIPKSKKRVFFGVRLCDLNAIARQDFIYIHQYDDPFYKVQREKSILIGYHCNEPPSKYCFCGSMNLDDYYDAMFFDKGKYFLVEVKTEPAGKILKKFLKKTDKRITKKDRKIDTDRLKKKDIKDLYDHKDWKKGYDKCFSCGVCTIMCPTCYCHEIHDEISLTDIKKGKRVREWSSCQLNAFTRVAGDHVFRDKREDRFISIYTIYPLCKIIRALNVFLIRFTLVFIGNLILYIKVYCFSKLRPCC